MQSLHRCLESGGGISRCGMFFTSTLIYKQFLTTKKILFAEFYFMTKRNCSISIMNSTGNFQNIKRRSILEKYWVRSVTNKEESPFVVRMDWSIKTHPTSLRLFWALYPGIKFFNVFKVSFWRLFNECSAVSYAVNIRNNRRFSSASFGEGLLFSSYPMIFFAGNFLHNT